MPDEQRWLEVYVEEQPAQIALSTLIPRIAPDLPFQVFAFQGKPDLLAKLPKRLAAAAKYLPANGRILVLVDRDQADCLTLKERLEEIAEAAGLTTRHQSAQGRPLRVLNRIAIEELEAWFFGDVPALCRAFPGVPDTLSSRASYRDPDSIRGGTAEALERVLKAAGHCLGGLPKIDTARRIAEHMHPEANRSKSFQVFREGLKELAGMLETSDQAGSSN